MRLPGDRIAHGQELGFAPGPGVKQVLKGQQQGYHDCGQGRHARPLVVIWSSLPCSYNLAIFCTKSRYLVRHHKTVWGSCETHGERPNRLIEHTAHAALTLLSAQITMN